MNKSTIVESNGENIMDFLEILIEKNLEKEVILNSISYYFANSTSYINDWRTKYRKKRIKEQYSMLKTSNLSKEAIYRKIAKDLKKEFISKSIDARITTRVVRHAIESA